MTLDDAIRSATRSDLLQDEGVKLAAYRDSRGLLTIGIGRLIDASQPGAGLSLSEAYLLCDNDINRKASGLSDALPWIDHLDPVRQSALINMAFNLGVHGLLAFDKMLAALAAGNWIDAVDELQDSAWARQVQASRVQRISRMLGSGNR